jgi:hypothetical protein
MWLIVAGWVMTVGAAFLLPRLPRRRAGEAGMVSLLTDPGFLLMLATSATIQSSHALLYAFGTIHWLAAGYGAGTIGWLWALSVIAEIMLFWAGKNLLRRLKGPELFVMGAAAALIRWLLAGLGTGLPLLCLVQSLHGFSFAATHLAAVASRPKRLQLPASPAQPSSPRRAMPSLLDAYGIAARHVCYAALGRRSFFASGGDRSPSACCARKRWARSGGFRYRRRGRPHPDDQRGQMKTPLASFRISMSSIIR